MTDAQTLIDLLDCVQSNENTLGFTATTKWPRRFILYVYEVRPGEILFTYNDQGSTEIIRSRDKFEIALAMAKIEKEFMEVHLCKYETAAERSDYHWVTF